MRAAFASESRRSIFPMSGRAQKALEEGRSEIIEAYIDGEAMRSIADKVGVSESSLKKFLVREGWRYRGKGAYHKKTPLIADRLYRKFNKDIPKIASILNVKESRVMDWLGKEAVKKARKNPSTPNYVPSVGFYKRHSRGQIWTLEQYQHIVGLIKQLRTPWEIWQSAGASRERQRLAWKYVENTTETPPHFIVQYEKRREKFGKQVGQKIKTPEQEIAILYQELQSADEEIEALKQEIKRLKVIIDRGEPGIQRIKQRPLPPLPPEGRPLPYSPEVKRIKDSGRKELPPGQEEED